VRLPGAILALLLTAVAAGAPPAATVVEIRDYQYVPAVLTVAVGTTVTWINRDEDAHSVVSESARFHSNALDTGETFAFTFAVAGTYQVSCSLHSRMTSTVIVQ
jgi:plastocyanin